MNHSVDELQMNYPEEGMTQSSFQSGMRLILNPDL
jgi:hypothetical protein